MRSCVIWICWNAPWIRGPKNLCEEGQFCGTWLLATALSFKFCNWPPFWEELQHSEGTIHQYFGGENTQARECNAMVSKHRFKIQISFSYSEPSTPGQPGSAKALVRKVFIWERLRLCLHLEGGWRPQQLFFLWALPIATPGSQGVERCLCATLLTSSPRGYKWVNQLPCVVKVSPLEPTEVKSLCPVP